MQWHFNYVGVNFWKMHQRHVSDSFSTELFKYCNDKRQQNHDAIKQRNYLKAPKVIALAQTLALAFDW